MTSADDHRPTAHQEESASAALPDRPASSCAIAVLAGGLSLERHVSLRSGERVAEALTDRGYAVTRLDLDAQAVDRLLEGGFDLAYLALHGKAGEDGTVQRLLDLVGVPYTGPDALASALVWDKAICKGILQRAGLATPAWTALSSDAVRDLGAGHALGRVEQRLGSPVMVKPAQGGASMGVRQVEAAGNTEELSTALVGAFSYHDVALVEQLVAGTEVSVSVVAGQALPPVEIVPLHGSYDYAARYTHGETGFYAPARLEPATLERCEQVAVTAYQEVGCRHVSRVDMIIDEAGQPWVLELDTCPGLTETSLLPLAAQTHGWSFEHLCERIVRLALDDTAATAATA